MLGRSRQTNRRKRLAYGGAILLGPAAAGAAMRFLRGRRGATEGAETAGPPQGEATTQPAAHAVSLHRVSESGRFDEAVAALRSQLGERAVGDPDEHGFFEVEVQADSWDAAVATVRDAVAAAGADEALELGEPSGRPG